MVYFGYNEDCPMSFEAIDTYNKYSKELFGNYNNGSFLGCKTLDIYKKIVKDIALTFNVMESEINFTSSTLEANNLALIGIALANSKKGRHIIVSKLEEASIYDICNYLISVGFEVSYVENDESGLVDFEDLKHLIREDTILVGVSAVNSSMGIRQPLKMIRQIIKKENPNTLFFSDLSNAIGKVSINFHDVDLATISSSLVYGPKGIALLYVSDAINIRPLLYGTKNELSSLEISIPLIASFAVALKNIVADIEKREHFVARLNEKVIKSLENYDNFIINKTNYSISHILNISVKNSTAGLIEKYLAEKGIIIGYSDSLDTSVMAVYNDKKRAFSTLKICFSYKTTTEEVGKLIDGLIEAYNKYCV